MKKGKSRRKKKSKRKAGVSTIEWVASPASSCDCCLRYCPHVGQWKGSRA